VSKRERPGVRISGGRIDSSARLSPESASGTADKVAQCLRGCVGLILVNAVELDKKKDTNVKQATFDLLIVGMQFTCILAWLLQLFFLTF